MNKFALALAGTAFAATAASANPIAFTGPYAGVSLGAGHVSSKYKEVNNPAALTSTSDHGGAGAIGGLELGYQKAFPNNFVLGLALNGDLSNLRARHKLSDQSFKSEERLRNSFGAALKLGTLINATTLAYLKVGVDSAQWRVRIIDGGAVMGNKKGKKRLTAVYPAVGLETKIAERLNGGIEGRYVPYGRQKVTTQAAGAAPKIYTLKPRVLDVRVTFKYQLSGFGF